MLMSTPICTIFAVQRQLSYLERGFSLCNVVFLLSFSILALGVR